MPSQRCIGFIGCCVRFNCGAVMAQLLRQGSLMAGHPTRCPACVMAAPLPTIPSSRYNSSGGTCIHHTAPHPRPVRNRRGVQASSTFSTQHTLPADVCGDLPIKEVIMDVLHALDSNVAAVLQAPPGAGKTSTVPLALLAHNPGYLQSTGQQPKTILVLEPRRVAAKAAARRMAAILGDKVGGVVGYSVRLETRVTRATRIEVVTEGVLLRRLQSDPELSGVAAILFDEFHERNLDADLALSLTLDLQSIARPDLRLLVMSATLGGGLAERVASLMQPNNTAFTQMSPTSPAGLQTSDTVPILTSEGRSYPVKVKYLGVPSERQGLEQAMAEAVLTALAAQDRGSAPRGDVLCFLPGVAEIRNTERLLLPQLGRQIEVQQLHGGLAPREQDRVVGWKHVEGGIRRIILSTPIAESSLTLSGVTAVVDSGQRRSPSYDTATGVNRLKTKYISVASAEQRAGRAGRVGPGVCYRLWSESDVLDDTTPPEIAEADLAPLVLQLAVWGVPVAQAAAAQQSVPWLDPPPRDRLADAVELLQELGALNQQGSVTAEGRIMAGMGVHPRLAAMVRRGSALGAPQLAALLAALLSERDILRGARLPCRTASITLRLAALAAVAGGNPTHVAGAVEMLGVVGPIEAVLQAIDRAGAERVLLGARSVASSLEQSESRSESGQGTANTSDDEGQGDSDDDAETSSDAGIRHVKPKGAQVTDDKQWHQQWISQAGREGLAGALVASAYPDRLAVRLDRSNARVSFSMSGGATVRLLDEADPLGKTAEFLAVAELGGAREGTVNNDSVQLAAPLSRSVVDRYLKDIITTRKVVFWASGSKTVLARQQRRLGCLVLDERSVPITDEEALPALLQGFKELGGISNLGISRDLEAWRQRALWLRRCDIAASDESSIPDLSDAALISSAASWLPPYLLGARSKSDMQKLPWESIIKGMMSRDDVSRVERDVPPTLLLPTGTRARIDYSRDPPIASCRIQEVFGLAETPRVAGGRVPVALELLSPSQRPLQITSDLAGFWKSSYTAVRKEQKGRYPKHYWPDDPLQAEATRMTKKAMDAAAAAADDAAKAGPGSSGGGKGKGGKAGKKK